MALMPLHVGLADKILNTKKHLGLTDDELQAYLTALQQAMTVGVPADVVETLAKVHARYGMTAEDLERLATPITVITDGINPMETFSVPRRYLVGTNHPPTAKDNLMDTKRDVFTASNGIRLTPRADGSLYWMPGTSWTLLATALREYFTHERDEEIGRERDSEDPYLVAYPHPADPNQVRILDEGIGLSDTFHRNKMGVASNHHDYRAAARWFAAHPERKPWDEAEPGDVWALTGAGGLELPFRRTVTGWVSWTSEQVPYSAIHATAGRKLWPTDE